MYMYYLSSKFETQHDKEKHLIIKQV